MRTALLSTLMLLGIVISTQAGDCTVSKEFQIKHSQTLAGVLQDPAGAPLPGIEIELLSGKNVIQHLRTNNQGAYDFGEVPAGKYRIRVQYGGSPFCAPKVQCGREGCSLKPRLRLNPKNTVTVSD
jgi:hypothetical protein